MTSALTMEAVVAAFATAVAVWLWLGENPLDRLRPARAAPAWWPFRQGSPRIEFGTRRAAARAQAIADGVPVVCDLLAVCVEAGRPARTALRVVAEASEEPTRGILLGISHQIELGVDELHAWQALAKEPGYRGVARDMARSVRSGVALGDLLRGHAAQARASAETAARERARQVAVSGVLPLVTCFLPAFLLVGVVPIFGGIIGRLLG